MIQMHFCTTVSERITVPMHFSTYNSHKRMTGHVTWHLIQCYIHYVASSNCTVGTCSKQPNQALASEKTQ